MSTQGAAVAALTELQARQRPAHLSADPPDPDEQPPTPVRSQDETDVGWSEPPEPDDDERLYRDRPPHWQSG
jgi:hypothetical protein